MTEKTETPELILAKTRTDTALWKRRYNEAIRAGLAIQRQMDAITGLGGVPVIQKFKRPGRLKSNRVAVVVPASDWHVEERVEKEAVNGKNEFNIKIAEERIKVFYTKVPELIDWQEHQVLVAEIWHPLLGDLLSGYIHEELIETNAMSPTEACVFLQEMICSGIDFWLKETKLPIILPTCCGNHSRTTARKRIKTNYANSFEWLLYVTLAKFYRNNSRVTWLIGRGYHNIQTIMGRKVRFHHGDGLRYMGGVGGITIPVNKAIAQWQKVNTVDFDIFGHWHQFLWNYPTWVCCPALIGYTEFSVEIKAEFQHPAQAFIVIDRGLGMPLAYPIYLTKPWRKRSKK